MARKSDLMEFRCENCEKLQPVNKEKSNENWNVYDCNAVCECGGKYVMYMGEKIMLDLHRVEIAKTKYGEALFLDGKEIKGLKDFTITRKANNLSVIQIELLGKVKKVDECAESDAKEFAAWAEQFNKIFEEKNKAKDKNDCGYIGPTVPKFATGGVFPTDMKFPFHTGQCHGPELVGKLNNEIEITLEVDGEKLNELVVKSLNQINERKNRVGVFCNG